MTRILPVDLDAIEDIKSELILSLELQRGEGCDVRAVERLAVAFARAVRPLVDAPGLDCDPDVDEAVLAARGAWRALDDAFAETLRMAYLRDVPTSNLELATVWTTLRERAGFPLARRLREVVARARRGAADRPWDPALRGRAGAPDAEPLERALTALVRGDDLDVEDALVAITGELRFAFAEHVERHPDGVADLEIGVWKRPEILVAGDRWIRHGGARLTEVLMPRASRRFRNAFAALEGCFRPEPGGAASVARRVHEAPEAWRDRITRSLMLHPDHAVRRWAAENVEVASLWKAISPTTVPWPTIVTLLEHATSGRMAPARQKIVFDALYRRMLTITGRSDVLYARGAARILMHMDFFMEDAYFARLMTFLDVVEAHERRWDIGDGVLAGWVDRLRREKERAGRVPTREPVFDGIPRVVLRRLARDGHFWHLLATHPTTRIARETVPHIRTPERALRVARDHRVNPEVLGAIGRRRALFPRLAARLELLSNPHTPPAVSLEYVRDLTRADLERLLRRATLHPELRATLRRRLQDLR